MLEIRTIDSDVVTHEEQTQVIGIINNHAESDWMTAAIAVDILSMVMEVAKETKLLQEQMLSSGFPKEKLKQLDILDYTNKFCESYRQFAEETKGIDEDGTR